MLQIRNVPDDVHRQLKSRAAREGVSMSHFVLREIERILQRPSQEELLAAIARLPEVTPKESPADVLREVRDAR